MTSDESPPRITSGSPDARFALSGSGGYPEKEKLLRLWELDWEYESDPKHDPVLKRRTEPTPK
jgi:hypothetical protein